MKRENVLGVVQGVLEESDCLKNIKILSNLPPERITGEIIVNESYVFSFTMYLPENFPFSLPVFCINYKKRLVLPHVDFRGVVCYANNSDILIDVSRPNDIIKEVIFKVKKILADGLSRKNAQDIWAELDAYWNGDTTAMSFVSNLERCKLVNAFWGVNHELYALSDSDQLEKNYVEKVKYKNKAIYLPINLAVEKLIFFLEKNHLTTEDVKNILDLSDPVFLNYCKKLKEREYSLILGVKNNIGERTLLGLRFKIIGRSYWKKVDFLNVLNSEKGYRCSKVNIKRMDSQYVIKRGGGFVELQEKKVLIVGCGAVGSVIADLLCKSGVGEIVLIDKDRFDIDNLYRHTLGKGDVGFSKVAAIVRDLREKFPFVKMTGLFMDAHDCFEKGSLLGFDLIISATGDPTFNLRLNNFLMKEHDGVPAIFTWLEPLEIGGHALLANAAKEQNGCLACLFDESFVNRAAFAAPGQSFMKRLSGCATSFVPYGAVAATRTACLATELAVGFLRGLLSDHPIRSWKGSDRDFKSLGYAVSERFYLSQDDIDAQSLKYKREDCSVCSYRRGGC